MSLRRFPRWTLIWGIAFIVEGALIGLGQVITLAMALLMLEMIAVPTLIVGIVYLWEYGFLDTVSFICLKVMQARCAVLARRDAREKARADAWASLGSPVTAE